ncbi:MAG: MazG nucleotide pyrophosphohydrolase domain-containing protein [Anaerolineae bacterium]|jgi:NTP pyrophosphatase (non-canonical NTP hydrolase)
MDEWQGEVAAFLGRHHLGHDPATHALDLVSEIGELAKELVLATDYGRQQAEPNPDLSGELGDALYSLLALATACHVDAGEALQAALEKYERRLVERGDARSR